MYLSWVGSVPLSFLKTKGCGQGQEFNPPQICEARVFERRLVFPAFVSRRRKITSAKTNPQTISMTSFFLDQSQFGSGKSRTKHACLA